MKLGRRKAEGHPVGSKAASIGLESYIPSEKESFLGGMVGNVCVVRW